jgi:hypothetical protein
MTRSIAESIARLALARGADGDEFTSSVYLETLIDLDADVMRRACSGLSKQSRGEFESAMPSVGQIRERCAEIAQTDLETQQRMLLGAAPKSENHEPTFYCLDCQDEPNGWRESRCRGVAPFAASDDGKYSPCGRTHSHLPHPFVDRCRCLPHNPVIAAARDRMMKSVQKHSGRRA